MNEQELRERFLQFFAGKGHTIVPSSSLVPHNDPTLLFTNAGMVQFKDVFLGLEKRPYSRAVTVQKCVRAGGKHNDLDTVGRTARHHTFFEMLGNFSFGDYFKKEAITMAWEFLTMDLKLDKSRLYVTVYEEDDEAFELWQKLAGVSAERIYRMGAKDNFWAMGDTGPCGPCSEIFYDRGEKYSCGPDCAMGVCDCDRWMEVWNLVFMQYERDSEGKLSPLPNPSIDTGMGLERMISVLNEKDSNYDIPVFQTIIKCLEEKSGQVYDGGPVGFPFRVVADHLRSCSFLIADGVLPSNEGRGYVLRRILRRAAVFGRNLGMKEPFLGGLVPVLVDLMGSAYPSLNEQAEFIAKVITAEEERFDLTLNGGLQLVAQIVEGLKKEGGRVINGTEAFRLYDTYGFPLDLTRDIAAEHGLEIDEAGFNAAMQEQKARARAARNEANDNSELQELLLLFSDMPATSFCGYEQNETETRVLAVLNEDKRLSQKAKSGYVLFADTPCYAEGGGQVGDTGRLSWPNGRANIMDTQKLPGGFFLHKYVAERGELYTGMPARIRLDVPRRRMIAANHSATHLLQYALRQVLGSHVQQRGSSVAPERLRFDFTHLAPLSAEEISAVEGIVNDLIWQNYSVNVNIKSREQAESEGALAFFGDKYGEDVRMVTIGPSRELCGGTHCGSTGEIGLFVIVAQGGIGAGVRRIEALTGREAFLFLQNRVKALDEVTETLKTSWDKVQDKVVELQSELKVKDKALAATKQDGQKEELSSILQAGQKIGKVEVLSGIVSAGDMAELRHMADDLKARVASAVIVLGAVAEGKVLLAAAVTPDLTAVGFHAGQIVKAAAAAAGGGGGGRADMATAGGKDPSKLDDAIEAALETIAKQG